MSQTLEEMTARALAAEAEAGRLREALSTLVARLDAVHANGQYQSIWTIAQMNLGRYSGPTYTAELAAARAALERKP